MSKEIFDENIPDKIAIEIANLAIQEEIDGFVYRFSKSGKIDEQSFENTYAEMLKGRTKEYDINDIGTYSTSVYDNPRRCYKYLKLLAAKYREKYPHPIVMKGILSNGKYQRTKERNDADYEMG